MATGGHFGFNCEDDLQVDKLHLEWISRHRITWKQYLIRLPTLTGLEDVKYSYIQYGCWCHLRFHIEDDHKMKE